MASGGSLGESGTPIMAEKKGSQSAADNAVAAPHGPALSEQVAQQQEPHGFRSRSLTSETEQAKMNRPLSNVREAIIKVRDGQQYQWGEAVKKAFPIMEQLVEAVQTAVDNRRSTLFFVLWRSAVDAKAGKGWWGQFCKNFEETKKRDDESKVAQVEWEEWNALLFLRLHFGWDAADVIEDAGDEPVARRYTRHGELRRVLVIQQSWTPNMQYGSSSWSPQLEGFRVTWNMIRGARNCAFYCASFFHPAAIVAEGKPVRVNLDKDANASRLRMSKEDEKKVEQPQKEEEQPQEEEEELEEEEEEQQREDDQQTASVSNVRKSAEEEEEEEKKRKRERIGIWGTNEQTQHVVDEMRKAAALVSAELGIEAVKTPARKPMTAIEAKALAACLTKRNTQPFGTKKEAVAKALEPYLSQRSYVRLYLHKRVEAEAQVPAVAIGAPGTDLGYGLVQFHPATHQAELVFVFPGETRAGYVPVLIHGVPVFIDVDVRLMVQSWVDGRFRGGYSHYIRDVPTIQVMTSLNKDSPYCWFSAQATNSSAKLCALLVLSAIVNRGGPAGIKGEVVRLTFNLTWEHWLAASARGGKSL
jgi:hypothetical protein